MMIGNLRRPAMAAVMGGAALLMMAAGPAHAASTPPLFNLPGTPEGEKTFRNQLKIEPEEKVSYEDMQGKAISFAEFMALLSVEKSMSKSKAQSGNEVVLRVQRRQTKEEREAEDVKRYASFKLKPGQPLFDFNLAGLDGKAYDKSALVGRYSVVSFFFEACAPCVAEVPSLNKFRELHPELNLVALTYDDRSKAQRFQDRHKLNWPILIESRQFNTDLGVTTYPSFAVFDPAGRLLGYRILGGMPNADEAAGKAEHATLAAWVKGLIAKAETTRP